MVAAVVVVVVGHIWNVCKVSGIRAMPSHVNNQKLQPRFQTSKRAHRSRVSHLRLCTADRSGGRSPAIYAAVSYVCMRDSRVYDSRAHTRPSFIYRAALR